MDGERLDDGRYDPDLEARLYEQIYYSNETYPDSNVNSGYSNYAAPSSSSNLPVLPQNRININSSESQRPSHNDFHWAIDTRPGPDNRNSTMYSIDDNLAGMRNYAAPMVAPCFPSTNIFRKPYRALRDGYQSPHGYPQPLHQMHDIRYPPRHYEDRLEYSERLPSRSLRNSNATHRSFLRVDSPKANTKRIEQFQKRKEANRNARKRKKNLKKTTMQISGPHSQQDLPREFETSASIEGPMIDNELNRAPFSALNESAQVNLGDVENISSNKDCLTALVNEIPATVDSTVTEVIDEENIEEPVPSCSNDPSSEVTNKSTEVSSDVVSIQHENVEENSNGSKYNVTKKNTKINDPVAEKSDGNDSESDASIFEVPVPPKPQPPLINLPDSDEVDSSDEESPVVRETKSPEPLISQESEDSNDSRHTSPEAAKDNDSSEKTSEASPLTAQNNDPSKNSRISSLHETQDSTENTEAVSAGPQVSQNLILNCTEVRRGISTFAEIKRMRESAKENHAEEDDDSMTESEAMNWVSIEVEMTNEKETQRQNESQIDNESWQNFGNSVPTGEPENLALSSDNIAEQGTIELINQTEPVSDDELAPVDTPIVANRDKEVEPTSLVHLPLSDDEMGPPEVPKIVGSRKRPHNSIQNTESNRQVERNYLRKRQKQLEKSSADMSFEEYIFQPMPKQLVNFYNEPCKIDEMFEVSEIQRKMPRDPARWPILHEDVVGLRRRHQKSLCGYCQKEGHRAGSCPQKSKTVICRMCGKFGHRDVRCPSTMCLTCGRKYSSYRKNCEICRQQRCTNCKGYGHDKNRCPDLWRKYHITIKGTSPRIPPNPQLVLKPPSRLSCCNCAEWGHDSSKCKKYRWSQHFVTPYYVTNYSNGPCYDIDNRHHHSDPQNTSTLLNQEEIDLNVTDGYQRQEVTVQSQVIAAKLQDILSKRQATSSISNDVAKNITPEVIQAIQTLLQQPAELQQAIVSSVNQPKCLFSFSKNKSKPASWKSTVINLKNDGIQYPYDENKKPALPHFLKQQFTKTLHPLEVVIWKNPNPETDFAISMSAPDENSLIALKLLMHQWLGRDSEDRKTMNEAAPLPKVRKILREFLEEKIDDFARHTELTGYYCVRKIKSLRRNKPIKHAETKAINIWRKQILQLKKRLVACVYNYGLNINGKRMVREVQTLIKELSKKSLKAENVSLALYLSAAWYNFELFTGHLGSEIEEPGKKWRAAVQRNKGVPIQLIPELKCKTSNAEESKKKSKEKKKSVERSNILNRSAAELSTNSSLSMSSSETDQQPENSKQSTEPSPTKNKKKKKKNKDKNQSIGEVEVIDIDDDYEETVAVEVSPISEDDNISEPQESTEKIPLKESHKNSENIESFNSGHENDRQNVTSIQISDELTESSMSNASHSPKKSLQNKKDRVPSTKDKSSSSAKKSSKQNREPPLLIDNIGESLTNEVDRTPKNSLRHKKDQRSLAEDGNEIHSKKSSKHSRERLPSSKDVDATLENVSLYQRISTIKKSSKHNKERRSSVGDKTEDFLHDDVGSSPRSSSNQRKDSLVPSEDKTNETPKRSSKYDRERLLSTGDKTEDISSNYVYETPKNSSNKKRDKRTLVDDQTYVTPKRSRHDKERLLSTGDNTEDISSNYVDETPRNSSHKKKDKGALVDVPTNETPKKSSRRNKERQPSTEDTIDETILNDVDATAKKSSQQSKESSINDSTNEKLTSDVDQTSSSSQNNHDKQNSTGCIKVETRFNGVTVEITNLPAEYVPVRDKRSMDAESVLRHAMAAADYVRKNKLTNLIKNADKVLEKARLLLGNKSDIILLWKAIIIAIKEREGSGKKNGTIVSYPSTSCE